MGAKINNSDLTKALIDGARLHPARDRIPDEIADKVVPVIDVLPEHNRICNSVSSVSTVASGNVTVFTTPADKDFFLVAATLSGAKDATADDGTGNSFSLSSTINAVSRVLLEINGIALTALTGNQTISYSRPIKLDRNVTVLLGGAAFTVGAKTRFASIQGYTVETE